MIPTCQRTRHSPWRMFFIIIVFLFHVNNSELVPTGKLGDTSSPSSPPTLSGGSSTARRSQEIGSPSELAWQAWLLLDAQAGAHSGLDSASLLRRITPKSVFIAPALPACADGYRADTMGRCVKIVNIDQEAHINFLLQRLNAMYSNRDSSPAASGPLQLNIPLLSDTNPQSAKHDEETGDSIEVPDVDANEKEEAQEAIVTVYEIKNTTSDEDGATFFLGNSSASAIVDDHRESPSKPDAVVPVAEFVDDANETSFSEIVDYKIPIGLKTIFNVSNITDLSGGDTHDSLTSESQTSNSTEMSQTLVLLLSPTKLPNMAQPLDIDDLRLNHNSTTGHLIVQTTNSTVNTTGKEIISVSLPESVAPPLKKLSEVPLIVVDKLSGNETAFEAQNTRIKESQEVEPLYDDEVEDEDYVESTDLPDEESDELEGGEILKHGEAGMTIPVKNIERLQLEKQRQQMQQVNGTRRNETMEIDSLDDSKPERREKDETISSVSSEVSIKDDVIVETTLLDVNTDKIQNTSKSSDQNNASKLADEDEDIKDLFEQEKLLQSEPEVIFSRQDIHGTVSTRLHERKRTEVPKVQAQLFENSNNDELDAAPSSSESLLYDPGSQDRYPGRGSIAEIHTMNEKTNKEIVFPVDTKNTNSHRSSESNLHAKTSKPGAPGFRPTQDYVRFPNHVRQPIRFPSEEVNSIHNQDYKDRPSSYPLDDGLHSSTKSSVPMQQKNYWWIPSAWRSDRQQVAGQQPQTTVSSQRHKQQPMLLRFWTNMPLVRDPSLSPTSQGPQSETIGSQQRVNREFLHRSSPRRVNFYKEMSAQDLNRLLIQKSRIPIGG